MLPLERKNGKKETTKICLILHDGKSVAIILPFIQSHLKISNESDHRLTGIRSACVKFYASDLGEWGCYCG